VARTMINTAPRGPSTISITRRHGKIFGKIDPPLRNYKIAGGGGQYLGPFSVEKVAGFSIMNGLR
jgi:hypothetical protein